MEKEKQFSLWFMLPGLKHRDFAELIYKLSQRYDTPIFEPHVTLLGKITGQEDEIREKASRLSASLKPVEIHLKDVDFSYDYFKCLFVRVKETKTLMQANQLARESFSMQNGAYSPHLSLLYGSLEHEKKERLALVYSRTLETYFTARSLDLFLTEGEVKNWRRIQSFDLVPPRTMPKLN